ncbi:phosphoribosylformylglycinamidine cyclo-ligase [Wolbachia endosymbiont of Pentidionis agamae]|uniref:phosphoribosylformylglycinamidine cyclo-ligase n=1 Tax=Wolbachia endosymbiont of Pentidionis agamae TaxID=3110435 RepID=UPI002FCF91B1
MNIYVKSGVNLNLYNKLMKKVKPVIESTSNKEVISKLGSFAALFDLSNLNKKYKDPILVSSTDGVGTKLLIAQEIGKHETIGIDLVAMCINDILTQGATPLFFLDYFAAGTINEEIVSSVISGIADGCKKAGVALIGGETAEMPGMYSKKHYDLAGFVVGIVEKEKILPKYDSMKKDDYILGLESSGIHSNGFSLVRHIIKNCNINYNDLSPWSNRSWGDVLLTPTKIYVSSLLPIMSQVKGIAHITGGGLIDNVPRVLPENLIPDIDINSWKWPEIFVWLKEHGNISESEMTKVFNCGIGIVLIVSNENLQAIESHFDALGEKIHIIGRLNNR